MPEIKKVLIDPEGNRYYWSEGNLSTHSGIIKEEKIKKSKNSVKSHINKTFLVFDATFMDKIEKIKRGPAIITKKDIGYIIASTGINSKSKIVDAGSGSGMLASFLANITDNVITYERDKRFFELSKKNFQNLNLKIKLKNKDVYDKIDEKNLDLITLDLPEPWRVLKHAKKSLKNGAFLVCYLPTITQVITLVKNSEKDFILEKVVELMEREWHVENIRVRPKSQMIAHTAFLVFLRNV
ncbi:methyltransferase [Candidatus Woesearchaeota archaeon]|nr:methyltransferase [Candidatus Woesearchaeota archaeon]